MSELVDTFLKYKGFVKEKGGSNAPLMPNILADSIYLCWYEFLRGKLKQEAKLQANKMYYFYRKFNKEFFAGFDDVQADICVNTMNDFEDFTKNDICLFKSAVINRMKGVDIKKAEMVSHLALCKFLASQANEIWGIIYKKNNNECDVNMNLAQVFIASREMLNAYTKSNLPKEWRNIDLSDDPDIKESMKRFEARVMEFIRIWK